ncbi:VIT1/CCC1 family protein [Haladaptatus sp. DYF46]|uniref:VIT1/CCC1 transporter family protein n=1 Tax=Haladaptatus sp. DYF46 TaxID=2886041 RepID=UPI001E3CD843|nr:VIT1/CCC1 family protein [Haladaptatus sp. DYF46]
MKSGDVERWRNNWQDEVDGAALYRAMAESESNPELAELYRNLAETEGEHADFWATKLDDADEPVGLPAPSRRVRTLAWLARRFGANFVLPAVRGSEIGGSVEYHRQPDADSSLVDDERSHAHLLANLDTSSGVEGGTLARLEGRHHATSGNALRAAVLGANDGLVSNLSLVMGVAGAALAPTSILITGLAGLLAGAGSMAMGEWLSVTSSRELYQRQIGVEAEELAEVPEEEETELALIYRAKGLSREQAEELAAQIVSDRETALDTLAREELGIDPEGLGGSAWEAAGSSFVLFALGAIVPVAPFAVFSGLTAVGVSLLASALALFAIGAGITLLTGRSVLYSGGRQVLIGLAAAALTFGVGRLIGVTIAG